MRGCASFGRRRCKRSAGSPRQTSGWKRLRGVEPMRRFWPVLPRSASGVAASQAINKYFLGDVSGIAETARPVLELAEAGSDYWRSALLTTFGVSVFLGGEDGTASALLDEAVSVEQRVRALPSADTRSRLVRRRPCGDRCVWSRGSGVGRHRSAPPKAGRADELLRHVHGARCPREAAREAGAVERGRRGSRPVV